MYVPNIRNMIYDEKLVLNKIYNHKSAYLFFTFFREIFYCKFEEQNQYESIIHY